MRKMKRGRDWTPDLQGNPQRKGMCMKIVFRAPKKPNSAKRRIAKVELYVRNKKRVQTIPAWVYVPGEGSALDKHMQILVKGGRVPDLPGVKYRVVRGKLNMHSVLKRKQGRSKYGTKNWAKIKITRDPVAPRELRPFEKRWNYPFYTPKQWSPLRSKGWRLLEQLKNESPEKILSEVKKQLFDNHKTKH